MYGSPYQQFINQTTPQYGYQQAKPPMTQQPMSNPYMQQPQVSYSQETIVEVDGMKGADYYQMAENSSVLLLDKKSPIVYLKTTDGARCPNIQAFHLTPVEDVQPTTNTDIEKRLQEIESKLEGIINEQSVITSNANTSTTNATSKPSNKSNASS